MRFTRTLCSSVLTLGFALSAAPALAADVGTERWLWEDRPACPLGETAVWVDREATIGKFYRDPFTGRITWEPGEPAYHGWECQPIRLRVIGP